MKREGYQQMVSEGDSKERKRRRDGIKYQVSSIKRVGLATAINNRLVPGISQLTTRCFTNRTIPRPV